MTRDEFLKLSDREKPYCLGKIFSSIDDLIKFDDQAINEEIINYFDNIGVNQVKALVNICNVVYSEAFADGSDYMLRKMSK